ncbi:high affinity sulfate permease [Scheffersomyces coipomensis]|uniref:high affinity sulfate permease n=1 Tax=Scheffersomyces coipomensis TaxID=1788519 RepID=UPI00315C70E7
MSNIESEVPNLLGHEDLTSYISKKSHEFQEPKYNNYPRGDGTIVPEYNEVEPTAIGWVRDVIGHPGHKLRDYLFSLFPILKWILHYNVQWLYGDLVAGITVGVVLVPQSMSYAQLAGLQAQFGLYSSFVGVFIYSFFATSKDVSIGPVAVMSAQVGKVIASVQSAVGTAKYQPQDIATFLNLICGGIALGLGIFRLGFILEFISIPAVMGFMSGSAINIAAGQVPALMGFSSLVNTRAATYEVIIQSLKALPHTTVDAAFGLVPLAILIFWKWFTEFGQKRWPKYKWYFFYVQQLRNAIVIIVATAISWGVVHPKKIAFKGAASKFKPPFSTIGVVPSGLQDVGLYHPPNGIVHDLAPYIPISTIILLLEHIAISKSFGRVNDYKVIPDQEVIAIGVTNLVGTVFHAYPATGSFSRSALKAKCGVRTPVAGLFTGAVVLLALYCLTSTFYYIPKATLSAVIIHAVSDLVADYKVTWGFWNVSPLDCGMFVINIIITVFATIEEGCYFAIAASAAVLLFRIAKPQGHFLGRVQVAEVINPTIAQSEGEYRDGSNDSNDSSDDVEIHQVLEDSTEGKKVKEISSSTTSTNVRDLVSAHPNIKFHTRWVPLTKENLNAHINVQPPPPGVIVFKPIESFTYPNSSRQIDIIADEAKRLTRRGKPYDSLSVGSRPWNDPGPLRFKVPFLNNKTVHEVDQVAETRPLLRVLHLDFSVVTNIDVTSIQALVDLRKQLNKYADREVEFHFSGILSPWVRRGLVQAGFGTYDQNGLVSDKTFVNIAADNDLENQYYAPIGTNTPFFHFEIPEY